jgi:hypothetical protein
VSVVSDITVYHRSTGDFDANWHRYHEIFLAAHATRLDRVAPQPRRVARIPFADIAVAAKEIDERRIAELTPHLREPGVRQT